MYHQRLVSSGEMRIRVKFFVFDLPPGFPDADLVLNTGAAVSNVLDACLELFRERCVFMEENELRTATVLVGGKWSGPDTMVSDGDIITIIRPMDGG